MRKKLTVTCAFLFIAVLPVVVKAQLQNGLSNTDTITAYQEILKACTEYQKPPLQMEMQIFNTSNFITDAEDTVQTNGVYFISANSAYIRFGEIEQFVTDSVALLVNDKLHQILFYPNAGEVTTAIKKLTPTMGNDQSVQQLAKKFTIQSFQENRLLAITLLSRQMLYGTTLPVEAIVFKFDAEKKQPLDVTVLNRILIPVSQVDYDALKARPELSGQLFAVAGKGHFLLKEQKKEFVYRSIRHLQGILPPATISDRILKNSTGEFETAKEYKEYTLVTN